MSAAPTVFTPTSDIHPSELSNISNSDEDVFFEALADFTLNSLENARETLTDLMKGLNGAERNKVAYVKEQVDKFIEQLQKAKKSSGLGKFFKALGIVGTVLAGLAAVLCPTPMTIAVFMVTLVMTMEPLLAEASGHDSLIQKGMSEMMKFFTEHMGTVGGAIFGAVLMLALLAACVYAAASGVSAASSAISSSTSATAQLLRQLPSMLQNFITGELTAAQQAAIVRVLETVEACITAAQSGLQFAMARLNFEVANLMYSFNLDQAFIDLIDNLTKSLGQNISEYQEHLNRLIQMMPDLFGNLKA